MSRLHSAVQHALEVMRGDYSPDQHIIALRILLSALNDTLPYMVDTRLIYDERQSVTVQEAMKQAWAVLEKAPGRADSPCWDALSRLYEAVETERGATPAEVLEAAEREAGQ